LGEQNGVSPDRADESAVTLRNADLANCDPPSPIFLLKGDDLGVGQWYKMFIASPRQKSSDQARDTTLYRRARGRWYQPWGGTGRDMYDRQAAECRPICGRKLVGRQAERREAERGVWVGAIDPGRAEERGVGVEHPTPVPGDIDSLRAEAAAERERPLDQGHRSSSLTELSGRHNARDAPTHHDHAHAHRLPPVDQVRLPSSRAHSLLTAATDAAPVLERFVSRKCRATEL
jgi:hypothetical protein